VERHFGGWYVEGGLVRLGEMLAKRCLAIGVSIRCSTGVASILTSRDSVGTELRCCGVVLTCGERVDADVVIANADAQHLYRDLLCTDQDNDTDSDAAREAKGSAQRSSPASLVGRLKRAAKLQGSTVADVKEAALRGLGSVQSSLSGFVLCCAVEGSTPDLAHHTVLFPERYDDEFDDLFGAKPCAVRSPTIYASVPKDPLIAPPGCEAWFVLVNAPRHVPGDPSKGIDWNAPGLADRYADTILDQMAQRGIDIRSRILFRELRTPADLEQQTGAVGGSIYGTSSNGMRAAFLRPQNQSAIPGLFLVGGSSHPGGGLPLVTLSAQIVAELVQRQPRNGAVSRG
jgi:phytoene dehydrogenase-like protein